MNRRRDEVGIVAIKAWLATEKGWALQAPSTPVAQPCESPRHFTALVSSLERQKTYFREVLEVSPNCCWDNELPAEPDVLGTGVQRQQEEPAIKTFCA